MSNTPERNGVELIRVERQRQVKVEGWTAEHDDRHRRSELMRAADAYLWAARCQADSPIFLPGSEAPSMWPWEESWWKPSDDPIRNLVKAGALIAAAIDSELRRA